MAAAEHPPALLDAILRLDKHPGDVVSNCLGCQFFCLIYGLRLNIIFGAGHFTSHFTIYHWAHVEKAQNTVVVLLDTSSNTSKDNQIAGIFSSIKQAEQVRDSLKPDSEYEIKAYKLDELV